MKHPHLSPLSDFTPIHSVSCLVRWGVTLAVMSTALPAWTAVAVSESLTGLGSLPPSLSASTDGAPAYTLGDARGIEMGEANNDRDFFRTVDTDYADVGFTAYLTFEARLESSGSWNNSQIFFGLGSGTATSGGDPDNGVSGAHSSLLLINRGTGSSTGGTTGANVSYIERIDGASNSSAQVNVDYNGLEDQTQVTTTAMRMTYDAGTGAIQWDLDYDYAGDGTYAAFSSDQSFTSGGGTVSGSIQTAWAGGAEARIWFGGDSDTNNSEHLFFRDFEVIPVPEPSSLMLMGVAAGVWMLIRKRVA